MRRRKIDRHLPACMYQRGPSYYLVKRNNWTNLGSDYVQALLEYARLTSGKQATGMAALIDKVLDYVEPKKSVNTMKQYRAAGERLKEMLAEFEPRQVLPKHVAAIKVHMASTPNMANRVVSVLRVVFNHALEWGDVDSNPCVGILRHEEAKRDRYISDDEFRALMAHCSDYMGAIFTMCYLTGQRIGDVLTIKHSDISDAGIAFAQQKTGAKLIVEMTDDLAAAIDRAKAIPRKVTAETLFSSRSSKPVCYESCKEAFAKARKDAGISNVTIHDLRAKSLTDTNRQGNNAQKLAGHADGRMTERYIRAREIDIGTPPTMPKKSG